MPPASAPPPTCALPGCDKPADRPPTGRPRRYCSDSHRQADYQRRREVRDTLGAERIGIDRATEYTPLRGEPDIDGGTGGNVIRPDRARGTIHKPHRAGAMQAEKQAERDARLIDNGQAPYSEKSPAGTVAEEPSPKANPFAPDLYGISLADHIRAFERDAERMRLRARALRFLLGTDS